MNAVAAILIHLNGAPRHKQEDTCLRYCADNGYTARTLVFTAADALRLVRCNAVAVVVAAYTPAGEADLAELVSRAGGRLVRVRRSSRAVREVGKLIARMFAGRMSVAEISAILELPTCDVRAELRKRRLN